MKVLDKTLQVPDAGSELAVWNEALFPSAEAIFAGCCWGTDKVGEGLKSLTLTMFHVQWNFCIHKICDFQWNLADIEVLEDKEASSIVDCLVCAELVHRIQTILLDFWRVKIKSPFQLSCRPGVMGFITFQLSVIAWSDKTHR